MNTDSVVNYLKRISVKTITMLFLMLLSLYSFVEIVHEVLAEKEDNVDKAVFTFLSHYINPQLTAVMTVISFFGSIYFLVPAYLILIIWLLIKKQKPVALTTTVIGITSSIIVFALKDIFHRVRPAYPINAETLTYSFPSGHTTSAFIFFGLLIWLIWSMNLSKKKKLLFSILLFVMSILIGISRIYLKKHFASDVVAGFCVGYSWLAFSLWTLNRIIKKKFNSDSLDSR